jgi:hypothetical protein
MPSLIKEPPTAEQIAYAAYKKAAQVLQEARAAVKKYVDANPDCRLPAAMVRHPEFARLQHEMREAQDAQNKALAAWAPLKTTNYSLHVPPGVKTSCPVCGNPMSIISNGWRCNQCGEQR